MLTQSFTTKNLKKIYENENKKGVYLDHHFPSEVGNLSIKLKRERALRKRLQKKKNTLSEEKYAELRKRIWKKIKALKSERNEHIEAHLHEISEKISSKKFKLEVKEHETPHHDKQTYKISGNLEHFFAGKQLQENIKKSYGVKHSDRDTIISQLIAILDDPFPKHIIRTDIASFYETIDKKQLQKEIDSNPQLSLASRRMIKRVLKEHEVLTGSSKGIPRGIGISAYLAELYMREADDLIKTLPHTIYYTRYVDDMIVVFSPSPDEDEPSHIEDLKKIIEGLGLSLNQKKTKHEDLRKKKDFKFEYLGYAFEYSSGLKIKISKNKVSQYKKRIDCSFNAYQKSHKGRNERRMLINRIRLLTGNTKLTNNKGGAFIGIYSSNKWSNDTSPLKGLDAYLAQKISTLACENLRTRLSKLSFEKGFEEKSFRHFTARQIGKLTKAWRTAK